MSKLKQQIKGMRKVVEKVVHCDVIRVNIPAGMAIAGPPLGPTLGQRGINIAAFCKDFNDRTKELKDGIPLPTRIRVNADRTYELVINKPPVSFYVKQAAGVQRASMGGSDIAGKITLKHVYEIAKIKQSDPFLRFEPLEAVCKKVIGTARACGIQVVRDLDPVEYGKFLEERKIIVAEQKKELQEKREAKMLRAAA